MSTESNLRSKFFAEGGAQTHSVRQLLINADHEELLWASKNRDFAESERFEEKDQVDAGLAHSGVTDRESRAVRALFDQHATDEALGRYVTRFDEVMRSLHYLLVAGAREAPTWEFPDLVAFWADLSAVTGLDNAHAMHLSSGNWGFNVLDPLVARFRSWLPPNDPALNSLLTGGILDARTYVPTQIGGRGLSKDRDQFTTECRGPSGVELLKIGIVPAMSFQASIMPDPVLSRLHERSSALEEEFQTASQRCIAVGGPAARPVVQAYAEVYRLRRDYDVYEYFGGYALMRHLILARVRRMLSESLSTDRYETFMRLASLYQYELAREVLNGN